MNSPRVRKGSPRGPRAGPARLPAAVRVLAASLLLGGCTVGPDFQAPSAPAEAAYTPRPVVLAAAGSAPAQRLQAGAALPRQWWSAFGDEGLDATVRLALADSPTLGQAAATLAQAREQVQVARGAAWPWLDLQASGTRASSQAGAGAAEQYSAGPLVSFAPDVFGGTRRRIEQQQALAEVQAEQLDALRLALSGQVVGQAIASASAREQLLGLREILDSDRSNLELVELARAAGRASGADVAAAQAQLAADQALEPALRQQLAAAQDTLALLVGRGAGAWQAPPFELSALRLPGELSLVVPSRLVRQRPDIRAAEAQLHAASAAIGVAEADLYPSVALDANWNLQSASLGTLLSGGQGWGLSAALGAPLWHGGALRAQRRAAQQAFEAQLQAYRQTVLQAFAQVADVLQALQHDAQAVQAQRLALASAADSLRMAREAYAAGAGSLLQVLAAQRAFAQARIGDAQARARQLGDSAQWFTVMGAVPR
ncbi:efflux transporter outer membrane subunit [Thiomonas sp. FB-6]|uniref:efflux transporter outer membrane subunit n=1 Tax=Thiomonas sp. FB-6 TaxID=1158291 RepID=UPI0009DB86E0|nr:efflux transporter outer membrane subunit [Thiomonas sp. FB-6]